MKTYNEIKQGVSELLSIKGVSFQTWDVQEYVENRLSKIENLRLTKYDGNIVAILSNTDGEGINLGLNAHMDTVHAFGADRKVFLDKIEGDEYLSTNDKCLGADDRAGLELVLSIMEDFSNPESKIHDTFKGRLVAWITVDEEVGCLGAESLSKMGFFENLDMSITFDRRNERDIVCKNFSGDFCDVSYAKVFVKAGERIGQVWKPVSGSISDAVVSSEASVNSVNLSVGYDSEHTSNETLNLRALYDTYQLAHSFLAIVADAEITPFTYENWYSGTGTASYPYGNAYVADNEYFERFEGVTGGYDFSYEDDKDTRARMEVGIDGIEFQQKYFGEGGREYVDYINTSHEEFLDMVAEYLSERPSAYDELQRKITARSYDKW